MPNPASAYRLRDYAPSDAAALLHLFRDTVRRVNCRDYLPAQIQAWASEEIELAAWAARFEGHFGYVVVRCWQCRARPVSASAMR